MARKQSCGTAHGSRLTLRDYIQQKCTSDAGDGRPSQVRVRTELRPRTARIQGMWTVLAAHQPPGQVPPLSSLARSSPLSPVDELVNPTGGAKRHFLPASRQVRASVYLAFAPRKVASMHVVIGVRRGVGVYCRSSVSMYGMYNRVRGRCMDEKKKA